MEEDYRQGRLNGRTSFWSRSAWVPTHRLQFDDFVFLPMSFCFFSIVKSRGRCSNILIRDCPRKNRFWSRHHERHAYLFPRKPLKLTDSLARLQSGSHLYEGFNCTTTEHAFPEDKKLCQFILSWKVQNTTAKCDASDEKNLLQNRSVVNSVLAFLAIRDLICRNFKGGHYIPKQSNRKT